MANTVITSTTNAIKVVFNDDSSLVGIAKGTWAKKTVTAVKLEANTVSVETADSVGHWTISHQANTYNALVIDSVDGVAPSSLSDLYDKIVALLG